VPERRSPLRLLLRYAGVGVLNTLLGGGLIVLLQHGLGVTPLAANAGGYALGLLAGYGLQRRLVFHSRRPHRSGLPVYLGALAAAYALNAGVLQAALWAGVPALWAQAAALASYTACAYLLQRHAVFRPAPGKAAR
jgi:putative flippase GtrA